MVKIFIKDKEVIGAGAFNLKVGDIPGSTKWLYSQEEIEKAVEKLKMVTKKKNLCKLS